MSPPIFTPDGSEVSEIVLPDGSTASQVIGPDGNVVFEAGPDIPDSVVHQYSADTFTTGDSTWTDDVGNADMSMTGDPQAVTLNNGEDGVEGDGTDDYGLASIASVLNNNSMSYEFSFQTTESDIVSWGLNESTTGGNWFIGLNNDENFNNDPGNFLAFVRDTDKNTIAVSPSTNPGVNDGEVHKVTVDIVDAANNNVNIYIDGSEVSVAFGEQSSPDNFNFSRDFGFFGFNNVGTVEQFINIAHGIHRFHNQSTGGQTI